MADNNENKATEETPVEDKLAFANKQERSLIESDDPVWDKRKISIVGVVRSFIFQLRLDQELTRLSFPAIFFAPYSILETISYRELAHIEMLYSINMQADPLERMLTAVRFFLSTFAQETFEKKPYNPILGEVHRCFIQSEKYGPTAFCAEQVTHHPPVTAVHIRNEQENVDILSNVSFAVRFHGNSASVVTKGHLSLNINKFKETYHLTKCIPDLFVKNVILGTKRVYWHGDVVICCEKSGYGTNLRIRDHRNQTAISGEVYSLTDKKPIYELDGYAGGAIRIYPHKKKSEASELVDYNKAPKAPLIYLPQHLREPTNSFNVWSAVSKAIVENDLHKADDEKRIVEEAQRRRTAERNGVEPTQGIYFKRDNDSDNWSICDSEALVMPDELNTSKKSKEKKQKRKNRHKKKGEKEGDVNTEEVEAEPIHS